MWQHQISAQFALCIESINSATACCQVSLIPQFHAQASVSTHSLAEENKKKSHCKLQQTTRNRQQVILGNL